MASVSTYLTFDGNCEEALEFYAGVFGTSLSTPIMRMSEMPVPEGAPGVPADEADRVMHAALPTIGGHHLGASDISPSQGQVLKPGNQMQITLNCDGVDQLNHLFFGLSEGAGETFGPMTMFWGDEYATVTDRYGVNWMLVAPTEPAANA